MSEKVIIRRTSRIVLVSPRDSFLLMMTKAPDSSGFSRWITPGGGVDPGETHFEAAQRELFEETGQSLAVSPKPVWRCEFDVSWDQATHNRGYAEYFVAWARDEFEPSSEFWTREEHVDITQSQWWTLDELAATPDPFEPLSLPGVFSSVLSGPRPV